jgi:hypothetical protein
MPKGKKEYKRPGNQPAKRARLSAVESPKRLDQFGKRKLEFFAAARKGKDRSLSA